MKTLTIALDLSFITTELPPLKNVWEAFLISGARSVYKDNLDLRMLTRINSIIEKISSANGTVDLEDAEFDIFKDLKERGKFDPSYYKIGTQILKHIEGVK